LTYQAGDLNKKTDAQTKVGQEPQGGERGSRVPLREWPETNKHQKRRRGRRGVQMVWKTWAWLMGVWTGGDLKLRGMSHGRGAETHGKSIPGL